MRPLCRLITTLTVIVAGCHMAIAQPQGNTPLSISKSYPDSSAGLEQQFADALQFARMNDQSALQFSLDSLAIPDADTWIAARFSAEDVPLVQNEYRGSFKSSRSYIASIVETFGRFPDFALHVENSLTPKPHANTGYWGLFPSTTQPVNVENFRFTSTSSNPEHGPRSWVSSFVYIDGRFRMIGGTLPFWSEPSTILSDPMSIPPAEIHGRRVQGAAFRNHKVGPGIDAIVHLRIEIGRDGKPKRIQVISGEPEFVADANTYVQNAEFTTPPYVPSLANTKGEWDVEIVFFTQNLFQLAPKK